MYRIETDRRQRVSNGVQFLSYGFETILQLKNSYNILYNISKHFTSTYIVDQ